MTGYFKYWLVCLYKTKNNFLCVKMPDMILHGLFLLVHIVLIIDFYLVFSKFFKTIVKSKFSNKRKLPFTHYSQRQYQCYGKTLLQSTKRQRANFVTLPSQSTFYRRLSFMKLIIWIISSQD